MLVLGAVAAVIASGVVGGREPTALAQRARPVSFYVQVNAGNTDVPTGLEAGGVWTDFYVASDFMGFGQCRFKNGGATILVVTPFAPNHDASAHFATGVELSGPLAINCAAGGVKVFVSGSRP